MYIPDGCPGVHIHDGFGKVKYTTKGPSWGTRPSIDDHAITILNPGVYEITHTLRIAGEAEAKHYWKNGVFSAKVSVCVTGDKDKKTTLNYNVVNQDNDDFKFDQTYSITTHRYLKYGDILTAQFHDVYIEPYHGYDSTKACYFNAALTIKQIDAKHHYGYDSGYSMP
ncbi:MULTISPECIES: hypothetical protein [Bacillus]|uniref:hypothetical protein n=1 Tax=Bacillus TaxID=1386 RepID=UPI0002EB2E2F|nr:MULTISPECIES: hypothetical protein [Bacillus]